MSDGNDRTPLDGTSRGDIPAGGDERPHVQHGADQRAPTPHGPFASERATVAGKRRDTDERRDLLAVQSAELGEIGEERAAHHRTDTGDRRSRFSLARQTGLCWIVSSRSRSTAATRRSSQPTCSVMRRRIGVPGVLQPIALSGHHVQELTAARHQGPEFLQGHIRHRPRREVHPFRKERQELRIQAVGFGELPGGFGEVADLARMRHLPDA